MYREPEWKDEGQQTEVIWSCIPGKRRTGKGVMSVSVGRGREEGPGSECNREYLESVGTVLTEASRGAWSAPAGASQYGNKETRLYY